MDVSGSMCATDVRPNRLAVAQEAAREYVEDQPKGVRMALVVFSGFAELSVPDDRPKGARRRDRVAHDRRGTAIGAAMLKALDAIAEANPAVAPVGDAPETAAAPAEPEPGANGYMADIVAPHGWREQPRDRAAQRGALRSRAGACTQSGSGRKVRPRAPVRVRSSVAASSSRAGSGGGGGGGWGGRWGGGWRGGADIPTLQAIAKQTGGTYHGAEDADQLRDVFSGLTKDVATQKQSAEITWIVAALGALLATAAIAASMRESVS